MSQAVATAPEGARTSEWIAGVVVAVLAHIAVFGAATLAPAAEEQGARAQAAVEEHEGCTSVMTPSCVGDPVQLTQTVALEPESDMAPPRSRRCPEPMRRVMRYEHEPAPATEVDLLEAELVVRKGVETGKAQPSAQVQAKPAVARHRRVEQVRKLVAGGSKLDSILGGGETGAKRRSKLGAILGKSSGKKGGNALVSRKGSAYARELKSTVLGHFTVPGNVPPWLRKSLRCRVRITRMTATGRVLAYRVEKKSGNDAFDKAVRRLMNGYKAGIRALPAPPSHILTAINSRGFVIDFR